MEASGICLKALLWLMSDPHVAQSKASYFERDGFPSPSSSPVPSRSIFFFLRCFSPFLFLVSSSSSSLFRLLLPILPKKWPKRGYFLKI